MRWSDLPPAPEMVDVLDRVGEYAEQKESDRKRVWGTSFANACAVMMARAFQGRASFRGYEIRPNADGSGVESLTGVGGADGKKVDVLVSSLAAGLQVAVSLKAENFPSATGEFGKNLLNRSYEFSDEVRSIHLYQPRAVVVGVIFLPIMACADRKQRSSFHRATDILRARTNRKDRSLPTELYKGDLGFVALYAPHDVTLKNKEVVKRGVVRYCSAAAGAPRLGRPKVDETFTLADVIERIDAYYTAGVEQPVADRPPEDENDSDDS